MARSRRAMMRWAILIWLAASATAHNQPIPDKMDISARVLRGAGKANPCVRDGVLSDTEMCDPGPTVAASGCDEHCRTVWGYTCDGEVGHTSTCEKVSQDVCYSGAFPRCGPQLGGSAGTTMTVIGQGFKPEYQYKARFQLKTAEGQRTAGSSGPFVKYATGIFISATELRYLVPWFEMNVNELTRVAIVALLVLGPTANVTGNMFKCEDLAFGKQDKFYPGLYTSTTFRFTFDSRTMLLASNFVDDTIVKIDTVLNQVEKFTDPSGSRGILRRPYGLDIGPDGALYVASGGTRTIVRFDLQTGNFLNVFVNVKGDPRGIRWRENVLYVLDASLNRVMMYKIEARWNPRMSPTEAYMGIYLGVFTDGTFQTFCDRRDETRNKLPISLEQPYDLRFHSHNGSIRLFISSSQSKKVFRFNGINGEYEGEMTPFGVNMATGFDFSHQRLGSYTKLDPQAQGGAVKTRGLEKDPSFFVTGQYGGSLIQRYNGTTGEMINTIRDPGLKMASGLLTHGDHIYVAAYDTVRKYSIATGELDDVAAKSDDMLLGHMILAHRCS